MKFQPRKRLALVLAALAIPRSIAAPPPEPEDELKSAVVLSFLRYSEWPRQAPDAPLTVGVAGRASLIEALRRTIDGKPVNSHAIRIVELNAAADPQCCNVVYVATGKAAEIKQTLLGPHSSHALTIGESDQFLDYGGAVNLLLIDGHMGFEVSLAAIDRTGVSISSKLLRFGQVRAARNGRPPA